MKLKKPERLHIPASLSTYLSGAGEEIRTLDPNLGKVVLYQLSYSRTPPVFLLCCSSV